jgi:release factor glutamine methyltransferase
LRPSEVLLRATTYLERHGVESPRASAETLLAEVLKTDRAGLYTRVDGLSAVEARAFGRSLCLRCTGVPVQHLTGRQQFRNLELAVRPGVFVPRPETEMVVEAALEELGGTAEPVVVDVGTGTGAIALSIAQERPDAAVWATDLSVAAVDLARRNAARLGLEVRVVEGDLLGGLPRELARRVDAIVSNPPYVRSDELGALSREARADPELALRGGPDVYRRLAQESIDLLAPGGRLVVEIGAGHGDEVRALLAEGLDGVRVLPDLAGRDRVVIGRAR